MTEDGKTSLRGGFGHFYTPIQASAFNPFKGSYFFGAAENSREIKFRLLLA